MSLSKQVTIAQEAIRFVTTPDPRSPAIVVPVSSQNFSLVDIPDRGKTFRDCGLNLKFNNNSFDGFVFERVVDSQPGWHQLLFNPSMPVADEAEPFYSYNATGSESWPMVLTDLGFYQDLDFGVAGKDIDGEEFIAPGLYGRWAYIPEVSDHSGGVFVQEYLTSTSFAAGVLNSNKPVPTPVQAEVRGKTIQFPPCLHPDVEIERFGQEAEFVDAIVGRSDVQAGLPQFFPATSATRWAPFYKWDARRTETGLFHSVKTTFYPPRTPKLFIV